MLCIPNKMQAGYKTNAIELENFHTAFSEKLIVLNISTAFISHFILKKEEPLFTDS